MPARRLLTPEQRALAESFRLHDWTEKSLRRPYYLNGVGEARDVLRRTTGDVEPTDTSWIRIVAAMISEDDSFTDYIVRRNPIDPDWYDLEMSSAAIMCEWYLRNENGKPQ
ncbi:MAG TPA: hypothetical protein VGO31_01455 [Microbacteriaceae bacterium]|jgi:hypothetical protein|nr:hypothetical protein [Microbacteriaceae bacterium]